MNLYDIDDPRARIIPRVLDAQAVALGDAIWLRQNDRALTFLACAGLTRRYAAGLRALGLGKGDTIALVATPSIDAVLIAIGAARLGAVFAMISTDYHGAFLEEALAVSKARVLVIDADLSPRLRGLSASPADHVLTLDAEDTRASSSSLLEHGELDHDEDLDFLDPVQVWWSSGTTGKSKGVLHAHSSILHLARAWVTHKAQPGDVFYSCTPLYLGSSWNGAIWPSLVGGLTVAIDPVFSATRFWDRIRYYGATHFFTLGAMHMHLLKQPARSDDGRSGIRYGIAVPMSWDVIGAFKARFGVERMDQMYGSSETFMVFEARDEDGASWRGGAMGRPVPHYEVKLLDENDREVPVGEVGEICVRPREPGVMFLGYFGQPDLTLQTWRNLWHHTGDMAMRDTYGVFYFADRKQDYIRSNGRNISMFEVEAVVERCEDVIDVAAFGVASADLESEADLALAVVLRPGAMRDPEGLAAFINGNAPYYFVPRFIDFLDELPRNAHGRVLKNELRARDVAGHAWDLRKSAFKVAR